MAPQPMKKICASTTVTAVLVVLIEQNLHIALDAQQKVLLHVVVPPVFAGSSYLALKPVYNPYCGYSHKSAHMPR